MMHFGIPGKFIRIVKNSYDAMTCKVVHAGEMRKCEIVLW